MILFHGPVVLNSDIVTVSSVNVEGSRNSTARLWVKFDWRENGIEFSEQLWRKNDSGPTFHGIRIDCGELEHFVMFPLDHTQATMTITKEEGRIVWMKLIRKGWRRYEEPWFAVAGNNRGILARSK